MALPIFQSPVKELILLQNSWASQLNPVLANPTTSNLILKSVSLVTGTNTVNHLLGRKLQGWKLTRQRAAASIYDNQDANQSPNLTLILVSDADVVVDIEVY